MKKKKNNCTTPHGLVSLVSWRLW